MDKKGTFTLNGFVNELQGVTLSPRKYFSTMATSGGYIEPVIKAVIYGLVAAVLGLLFMGFGGALQIAIQPLAAVLGLFLGALIVMLLSLICGGSKDYQAAVRMTAVTFIVYPLSTLVSLVGIKFIDNYYIYAALSTLVSLYGLYLLYNGLSFTLRGKKMSVQIVVGIFAALTVLLVFAPWSKTTFTNTKMSMALQQVMGDPSAMSPEMMGAAPITPVEETAPAPVMAP